MQSGERVKIEKGKITYEGVLMPTTTGQVVIKLDNGYNIGFKNEGISIFLIEKKGVGPSKKKIDRPYRKDLPQLSILSTGGTIASKVDYRTGAVTSQFTADDILFAIPELEKIANYNSEVVYSILSENMKIEYWIELARRIAKEIENGAQGVIVTHGTDTMAYTASALSFMIETPVPIVLTGSQRSADRPSSDNAQNAVCAALVATSDIAEVTVVMHASDSDDSCYIHRGTKVRKMHTSARDAFKSINSPPLGKVDYQTKKIEISEKYRRRGERNLILKNHLEQKCALIKIYPGADPDILDFYVERGYRGIIIEGTGLGHVSTEWFGHIKNAIRNGIPIIMTSQCIYGRTCDRVYDTGRDLLRIGVIEGGDMLSETALVKLMWVLSETEDTKEVKKLMQANLVWELTDRTL